VSRRADPPRPRHGCKPESSQGRPDPYLVAADPHVVLRRLAPDPVQFQVILGSLLGDARIIGGPFERRLAIGHHAARASYVWWKYERLGPLAGGPPAERDGRLSFATIAHPLFDDLST